MRRLNLMRVAALVLGLLGSLILFFVGVLWTDNAVHLKEAEEAVQSVQALAKEAAASGQAPKADAATADLARTLAAVRGKAKASYAMAAAGLVAVVGSLFASFLLALAAVFALLAKPKPRKPVSA